MIFGPFQGPGEPSGAHEGDLSVKIGNDVWMGRNAQIMAGVTIGDGAVIGAGAIVTDNVPPYAIALGVPARPARCRFSDDQIRKLVQLR
jgi:virginiamycin A acetyltransferase